MKKEFVLERYYLILIDFILPIPMTILMFYLWYQKTGSYIFASYILLLGILFGYIFPGIGTNILKLWRFNWSFRMGNYFIHHGFMYAPYLALTFYISFAGGELLTIGNIIRIVLCSMFIQSVTSCHHDICGIKSGMIEINNAPAKQGKSAVEIVTDYGVIGFGMVGAAFAISNLIAYHYIVMKHVINIQFLLLLLIVGLSIMGAVSIPYMIHERNNIPDHIKAKFRIFTKKNH